MTESQALISPFDLGLLRGYGVFDFFRVLHGVPLFMEDHLARLIHSSRTLGLELPEDIKGIKNNILELVQLNKIDHGTIKMVLTGGISSNGFMADGAPSLFILTGKINFDLSNAYAEQKPLKLKCLEYKRETPGVKSLNYLIPIQHWKSLQAEGFDDLLYVYNHWISETSRANIFMVTQANTLVTPNEDILLGVTRNHVIQLAKEFMQVKIRPVSLEETKNCPEVFLSSTTKRIMPVSNIDQHKTGMASSGKVGHKLFEELILLENKYIEEFRSHPL